MARTAIINSFYFYVSCPHCHEPQPTPHDGDKLLYMEQKPPQQTCTSCQRVYDLPRRFVLSEAFATRKKEA